MEGRSFTQGAVGKRVDPVPSDRCYTPCYRTPEGWGLPNAWLAGEATEGKEVMTDREQERFDAKFARGDSCWPWHGARTKKGYGTFRKDGRTHYAHRVAYERTFGPIPDGLTIDHLCRNKLCVNPAHLEVVTRGENVRRYAATITHCPHGHPYDDENTCVRADGQRDCRACNRERMRRRAA